jgi:hypothetical protein
LAKEAFAYIGVNGNGADAPSSVSELIYGLRNDGWRDLASAYSQHDPEELERLAYLQYSGALIK